jgi:hypothetical protein
MFVSYGKAFGRKLSLVDALMSSSLHVHASTARPRQQMQSCTNLHLYLTEREWDIMQDPRFAWDSCKAALISRMDLLGLVYPNEQTLLTLWCLASESRPCRREQARPTAMLRAPARSSARARRDSVRS